MLLTDEYFPADYFAARSAFRDLAGAAEIIIHNITAPGPGGETLSIDTAYLGNPAPRQLLIFTSGIHGVEGVAGSALQQLWLEEFSTPLPGDCGVLLVHALNPYGFAHNRRVNEHNVDLNRNALSTFPGPSNPGYRSLDTWLNPPTPAPRVDMFLLRALPLLLRHGFTPLAKVIASGQYEFPRGLFYGGHEREPSLNIFSGLLAAKRFAGVQQVWHLDLHTGLGRYGRYQVLYDTPPGADEHSILSGGGGGGDTQSMQSHRTYRVSEFNAHGILPALTRRAFPKAHTLAATLEFGTLNPITLLRILRAENRVHHLGARHTGDAIRIREALRMAHTPRDPAWRNSVIAGGRHLFTRLQEILD